VNPRWARWGRVLGRWLMLALTGAAMTYFVPPPPEQGLPEWFPRAVDAVHRVPQQVRRRASELER
jgi:hypothetical protein